MSHERCLLEVTAQSMGANSFLSKTIFTLPSWSEINHITKPPFENQEGKKKTFLALKFWI